MKINKSNILLVSIMFVFVIIGILVYLKLDMNVEDNDKIFHKLENKYDADEEIQLAMTKLGQVSNKAEVVSSIDTVEKRIALTFDGLSDAETMLQIIELLNEYNIKATFFVQGIESAEDASTVLAIKNAGQQIGSYTLSGKKHMETMEDEEIVKDLVTTNVILEEIIGDQPDVLKCNVTKYTEDFLEIVSACEINSVVESDQFFSFQSFSSYNETKSYIKRLKKGSIISIKVEGVLGEEEYEVKEEDEEPAIDKQPTIQQKNEQIEKDISIVQTVEWLLKAINENNYTCEFIHEFTKFNDEDFQKDFELIQIYNDEKLAKVYNNVNTNNNIVAYSFRGIGDKERLDSILSFLNKHDIKATFFVTGNEATDYPERILKIVEAGHSIGNGGLTGTDMTTMDFEETYFELLKTHQILFNKYGVITNIFMPAYGKYSDITRQAANALGYSLVTYNKNAITDNQLSVDQIFSYFSKGIGQGDIIFFRLDHYDDLDKVLVKNLEQIIQEGFQVTDIPILLSFEYYNDYVKLPTESHDMESQSIESQLYQSNYIQLRVDNKGKKAELISNLYTAQPSVAYIFRGVSDKELLDHVLTVLDELDAKGSFFVTGKEILNFPENVQLIIDHGHQIYNGGYGMDVTNPSLLDFSSLCYEIEMGKELLKNFLGDAYNEEVNSLYMPLYADTDGDVLEAASALGYEKVVTYNKSAMNHKYKEMSIEDIISDYFSNTVSLHRGDIVYFRLDYLSKLGAIEELIQKVAKDYISPSKYSINLIHEMINNDLVYQPIEDESQMLQSNVEYSQKELLEMIMNRYIGNQSIATVNELIGFTSEEIFQVDKKGEIDTDGEKVIFLTFDDWGTDKAINKLLEVLKKHDAKATFFVRVGNDSLTVGDSMTNPNLLRAIALDGHDIGNHTFSHMKVNVTTQEEADELQEEIMAAHQEMYKYIGDTGALKLFFRPPTLAVSKLGFETIFDCGYEYIVNGDFSTHDYEAESVEELVDKLKNGMGKRRVQEGSIVVMHMSDESQYTAEALEEIIPYYQSQGYRFAKLSDYLRY